MNKPNIERRAVYARLPLRIAKNGKVDIEATTKCMSPVQMQGYKLDSKRLKADCKIRTTEQLIDC